MVNYHPWISGCVIYKKPYLFQTLLWAVLWHLDLTLRDATEKGKLVLLLTLREGFLSENLGRTLKEVEELRNRGEGNVNKVEGIAVCVRSTGFGEWSAGSRVRQLEAERWAGVWYLRVLCFEAQESVLYYCVQWSVVIFHSQPFALRFWINICQCTKFRQDLEREASWKPMFSRVR